MNILKPNMRVYYDGSAEDRVHDGVESASCERSYGKRDERGRNEPVTQSCEQQFFHSNVKALAFRMPSDSFHAWAQDGGPVLDRLLGS